MHSFYRQVLCGGIFNRYQTFKWMQTSWALPLILRKEKLTLQYITKLKSTSDNVPYTFVFELSCALFFEAKTSLIPTLRVWVKDLLLDTRIQFKCVDKSHLSSPPVSPWLLKPPESSVRRVGLVVKTPAWRSGGTGFNSQPGHVISLSKKFTHICLGQLSLSSSWGR